MHLHQAIYILTLATHFVSAVPVQLQLESLPSSIQDQLKNQQQNSTNEPEEIKKQGSSTSKVPSTTSTITSSAGKPTTVPMNPFMGEIVMLEGPPHVAPHHHSSAAVVPASQTNSDSAPAPSQSGSKSGGLTDGDIDLIAAGGVVVAAAGGTAAYLLYQRRKKIAAQEAQIAKRREAVAKQEAEANQKAEDEAVKKYWEDYETQKQARIAEEKRNSEQGLRDLDEAEKLEAERLADPEYYDKLQAEMQRLQEEADAMDEADADAWQNRAHDENLLETERMENIQDLRADIWAGRDAKTMAFDDAEEMKIMQKYIGLREDLDLEIIGENTDFNYRAQVWQKMAEDEARELDAFQNYVINRQIINQIPGGEKIEMLKDPARDIGLQQEVRLKILRAEVKKFEFRDRPSITMDGVAAEDTAKWYDSTVEKTLQNDIQKYLDSIVQKMKKGEIPATAEQIAHWRDMANRQEIMTERANADYANTHAEIFNGGGSSGDLIPSTPDTNVSPDAPIKVDPASNNDLNKIENDVEKELDKELVDGKLPDLNLDEFGEAFERAGR